MAKFSFLVSEEEPEMIFDWVDMERKGRLSLEEFSSGLSMSVLGGPLGTYCTASVPSMGQGWADRKGNSDTLPTRGPSQHP